MNRCLLVERCMEELREERGSVGNEIINNREERGELTGRE